MSAVGTSAFDEERLEVEMTEYHNRLDSETERLYQLATKARQKGLDFSTEIEIPRATDLADRTEKLLEEYLDGLEVAEKIRSMLQEEDRETTAIKIACQVSIEMMERTGDQQRSIDAGLRVGLAILTEAILVAPLEGIGQVRLLNNLDGSTFLSIDFCGPIRAAGGTAQAMAVLIGDMIRSELGLAKYEPTFAEVERVKEEFGLYRAGMQYKPSPEEIDVIVKSCPVMINGESTEDIECAGYREVRNIDDGRVRGGVLLVIGEGLCLKAPKLQKHVERLEIPGWDFISKFANKGKDARVDGIKESGGFQDWSKFKPKKIPTDSRFMKDIIAGRPVFGMPNEPGGFRLRYGRPRASGLAAAGMNPVSMKAMSSFISVGTQMKIERPGKACAVTPCTEIDGPMVLLDNGAFVRVNEEEKWNEIENQVRAIWDNGELMLGFGEFLENNKTLVPSAFTTEWWAAQVLDSIENQEDFEFLLSNLNLENSNFEKVSPWELRRRLRSKSERLGVEWQLRDWHHSLRHIVVDWHAAISISTRWNLPIHPSHNPQWSDLPIFILPKLIEALKESVIENEKLRIPNAVLGWTAPLIIESSPMVETITNNQTNLRRKESTSNQETKQLDVGIHNIPEIYSSELSESFGLNQHGLVKSALMCLGISHYHESDDIIIDEGWQGLLHGLGFSILNNKIIEGEGIRELIQSKLEKINNAKNVVNLENERIRILEEKRRSARIQAETAARQRGEGIAATELAGKEAQDEIENLGPEDEKALNEAKIEIDDNDVKHSLWVANRTNAFEWMDAVPCRIGCRMGRPEKSAPREMKQKAHALYPIQNYGGPQRLLATAVSREGSIRVTVGPRRCLRCDRETPHIRCHHRAIPNEPKECGGRTVPADRRGGHLRNRLGELTTIPLADILEVKRISLGLDRLPERIKAMKGLTSKAQYPEPIEKGILRAIHDVSAFRDGTIRYDMIDVPITHFRPIEIGTSVEKLVELGYTHDIRGNELLKDTQILELFPQDFIPSRDGGEHLLKISQYLDDLLVRFYKMEPEFNAKTIDDLVGQLGIALAPHTSGGVLCRFIGWTNASAGYGHTLFHAAKRRNCDGDEDCVMLLLDGLLNFSRVILPSSRGGRMDAPLTLTTRLNPMELDKEALHVDAGWGYSREFYVETLESPHPREIVGKKLVDLVNNRIGTVGAVRGYGYSHDLKALDAGPVNSAYKTLGSMTDKMSAQLALGRKLRGVDARIVASTVIGSHLLPDVRGNLNAFSRQKVRCAKCNHSYRRLPLAGKCIQMQGASGGLHGHHSSRMEETRCGGNLILTVSQGAVRKYLGVINHVIDNFGIDDYTQQYVDWMADSVESVFKNDRVTVYTLDDFL